MVEQWNTLKQMFVWCTVSEHLNLKWHFKEPMHFITRMPILHTQNETHQPQIMTKANKIIYTTGARYNRNLNS